MLQQQHTKRVKFYYRFLNEYTQFSVWETKRGKAEKMKSPQGDVM